MSLFRQLLIANSRKKKRKFYCEVEYLESTGTQWIDTGYTLNQDCAVEMSIYAKDKNASAFGSRSTASTNSFVVFVGNGVHKTDYITTDFYDYNTSRASCNSSSLNKRVKVECNKNYRRITDEATSTVLAENTNVISKTFITPTTARLFASTNMWNGNRNFIGNIYYCKIWDGDTLVRDFIPVLDWDMKPCMYDKVSGELFYNKATSGDDFIPGRQIHPVEYLESTGAPYIKTGIQPTDEYGYRIKNTYTRGSGEQCAIGCMDSGNRFVGVYTSGSANQLSGAWGSFVDYLPTYHWDTGDILDVEVNYKNSRKMIVNGTELKDISDVHISGTITNTLYLFARHYDGNITKMKGKVYCVEITNGQDVVADFIPAVDETGKAFMFDRVTHTIYDNAGTGAFSYPPVELEYLESTGTQYIDTGIIGTNENMGIDVTWAFSNNNANMCIFSSRSAQTSNTLTLFWLKTASNRVRFDGVGQRYFTDVVNASVSDDIFNFNYKSTTGAVATLTNKTTEHIQTLFVGKLETFSTKPLYLFCSRDSAYVYSWIKMYGCKIYDGDVVVRDYIPVFYNGKAGMWDKVNEVFYPNSGTGSFIVGRVKEDENKGE